MPGFITRNPRFKPTSITGCKVWLDATFMDTGSPSRWPDRSGNGNDAVPSGVINTVVPTFGSMNGLQTLRFTAANRTLVKTVLGSSFASGNETYFFVGQLTGSTPSATRILCDSTSQRQWLVGGTLPNTLCMYAGSTPTVKNLTVVAATPFLATSVNTAGTLLDYQNGTANTQSLSASTTTLSEFYLGGTNTGTDGDFMDGDIGEFIVYSTALTEPQRQQIEGYLAQKWGLLSALPPGHPAYSVTFYPSRPQIKPIVLSPSARNTLLIRSLNITLPPPLVFYLDAGNSASYPGTGTTWTDLAGSGITTTLYGNVTYSSNNGGVLMFTPTTGDYAQTSASLPALTTWTVELWHYYTNRNSGEGPCLVTEIFNSSPINLTLGVINGGGSSLQLAYFNGSSWLSSAAYTLPSVGWFHIVGTYDGTNLNLYINNTLIYSTPSSDTPTSSGLGYHIMRRWDQEGYVELWGGGLASLRIYRGALTPEQIAAQYDSTKSRFTTKTPMNIASGLVLWLDAADASTITDGDGGITAWRDKSYSQKTVTLTEVTPFYSATAFTGGKPCMTFSTSSILSVELGSEYMNQDFAMFVVWNQTSPGNATVVSVGTAGNETGLGMHATGSPPFLYNLYHYGGNESHSAKIYTIGTPVVQTGVRSSGNLTCSINSKVGDTVADNVGPNTSTTLYIGSGTFPITGQVCEVLLYSATLTTLQQQQIEGYLAWKWGLQGNLDSSNQYKTSAP